MEVRAVADEYYSIPDKPVYSEQIRMLRNDDPANADEVFNPLFERLIENTAAVKRQAEAGPDAITAEEIDGIIAAAGKLDGITADTQEAVSEEA